MKINWHNLPLRKPLAAYSALLIGVSVLISLLKGVDLPTNISELLQWFGGVTVAAYFASSTTEAIKGGK